MDWHAQLITLYLAVCSHWQEVGWVQAQRHAPYANLDFTDEEVVTIYLFAVAREQKLQIKDIHRHAGRYWRDWFPRLPGYSAYVQRAEPARGLLCGPVGAVLRDGRGGVFRRAGRLHAGDTRKAKGAASTPKSPPNWKAPVTARPSTCIITG